ncbi:MAG: hypothetical protein MHM6MM_002505 [Cercozoa sp. M6MM]
MFRLGQRMWNRASARASGPSARRGMSSTLPKRALVVDRLSQGGLCIGLRGGNLKSEMWKLFGLMLGLGTFGSYFYFLGPRQNDGLREALNLLNKHPRFREALLNDYGVASDEVLDLETSWFGYMSDLAGGIAVNARSAAIVALGERDKRIDEQKRLSGGRNGAGEDIFTTRQISLRTRCTLGADSKVIVTAVLGHVDELQKLRGGRQLLQHVLVVDTEMRRVYTLDVHAARRAGLPPEKAHLLVSRLHASDEQFTPSDTFMFAAGGVFAAALSALSIRSMKVREVPPVARSVLSFMASSPAVKQLNLPDVSRTLVVQSQKWTSRDRSSLRGVLRLVPQESAEKMVINFSPLKDPALDNSFELDMSLERREFDPVTLSPLEKPVVQVRRLNLQMEHKKKTKKTLDLLVGAGTTLADFEGISQDDWAHAVKNAAYAQPQ